MADIAVGITLKGDSTGLVTAVKTGEGALRDLGKAANDGVKPIAGHARESANAFAGLRGELTKIAAGWFTFQTGIELLKSTAETIMASEKATASLNAVLKATGGQAGLTAQQLADMATKLEKSTLFDDTDIKRAEAVLLTFQGVTKDTFGQAIKLSADLAAVFGTDLNTAALTLGKALESPVDGLGALSRAGVRFNDGEKAVIQGLVDTGRQADAASLILDKVAGKIGGAAEGQHTGLVGATHDLASAWDDLMKSIQNSPAMKALTNTLELMAKVISFVDRKAQDAPLVVAPGDNLLAMQKRLAAQANADARFGGIEDRAIAGQAPKGFFGPDPNTLLEPDSVLDAVGGAAWDKRKQAADDAAKAAAEAAKSTADYIAQLQLEADNLGRTSEQQDVYNALKAAGVTADSAAGQQITALITNIDTMKELQKELNDELAVEAQHRAEGKALMESLRTPLETYIAQMDDLNQKLAEGAISQETFDRASKKATETLDAQSAATDKLGEAAQQTGDALSSAFVDAIANGKSLSDVLNALLKDILNILAKAGTSSLSDLLGGLGKELIASLFGSGLPGGLTTGDVMDVSGGFGILPSAQGNVFLGGNVVPFRKGGVVSAPAIFPMANGAGLMGEAGPEAVMPLARGSDGSLGVRVAGGGGGDVQVIINNYSGQPATATQRTGADGMRTIEVMIGKAVAQNITARGDVARAMENNYGLRRGGTKR